VRSLEDSDRVAVQSTLLLNLHPTPAVNSLTHSLQLNLKGLQLQFLRTMAGSKKNKSKKSTPPQPVVDVPASVDEELMDDLFAQLDSRDQTQQRIMEPPPEPPISKVKTDSKSRFKARQVGS
jgi:hypothetical protein